MCKGRRMYRNLVAPLSMQVEVTSLCNCKCRHCYNYWRTDSDDFICSLSMTLDTAKRVLEECVSNHVFSVVITGGEPFLNFPVVKWLGENLKRNGIKVSLNTNLSLITDEQANWVVDNSFPVLTSILGSNEQIHDYITATPGSFVKTMHGIELLMSLGIPPAVNVVASELNFRYLPETLEMLCAKGIKALSITPAVQPEYCKDFSNFSLNNSELTFCLNLLMKIKEKYNVRVDTLTCIPLCALGDVIDPLYFSRRVCSIGRGQIACSANGDIRACSHYNISEGNIVNEGLALIWKRFEKWCFSESLPDTCLNCELLGMCNGGCRVESEAKTGRIDGMDPKAMPENVCKVICKLKAMQKKSNSITIGNKFKIFPYVYREEEFGACVDSCGIFPDVKFLTHEAINTLLQFQIGEVYNVSDVMQGVAYEDKVIFLTQLSKHKILGFLN